MSKIDCKFLNQTIKPMVNPDGQVWPCCYLCNDNYMDQGQNQEVFHEYEKSKDKQNLKNYTIKKIFDNKWFKKTLPESFKDKSKTLRQCKRWCTKND